MLKFLKGLLKFIRSLLIAFLVVLPVAIGGTIYMYRDYMNADGFRVLRDHFFPKPAREAQSIPDWGHSTIPPPNPNILEIAPLIRAGDYAGLAALVKRDPVVFNYFLDTSPDLAEPLDAWVVAQPRSVLPRLARGHYWRRVGWHRRGGASASKTTDTQFGELREAFQRAESDYLFALGLDPSAEVAYRRLLDIYMATGRDAEQMAVWQAALAKGAGTWRLHNTLFNALMPWWSGLPGPKSVAIIRSIVQEIESGTLQSTGDPALLRAYPDHVEAEILWRDGQRDKAMAKYVTIVDGTSGLIYLDIYASRLGSMGRHAESLGYFAASLRHEPSSPRAWTNYAWALNRLKRYKEAAEALDHALLLDPYRPSTLRQRASLNAKLERYRAALADYDSAKVFGSEQASVWAGAGRMRLRLFDDLPRAVADYHRAIELNPDRAFYYRRLGLVFDELRDCRAVPAYRSYLELCGRRDDCGSYTVSWVKVRWKGLVDRFVCSIDGARLTPKPAWMPVR